MAGRKRKRTRRRGGQLGQGYGHETPPTRMFQRALNDLWERGMNLEHRRVKNQYMTGANILADTQEIITAAEAFGVNCRCKWPKKDKQPPKCTCKIKATGRIAMGEKYIKELKAGRKS